MAVVDLPSFESRIEVIATGNELLDGTIADTNTQRLALKLKPLGLRIDRSSVIADDPQTISRALVEAASRSQIIIVSGGLGPTTDDLTLDVAAQTFGVPLIQSQVALQNVLRRLKKFGRKANAGNLKQSYVPEGSRVLQNDEGTAPGIEWKIGDRVFYFLPGVPREMTHLVDRHVLPSLQKRRSVAGKFLFTVKIYGMPESELSAWVQKLKRPRGVEVGFRTHLPENHIKFDVTAPSEKAALKIVQPLLKKCRQKFGSKFFGLDQVSFAQALVEEFKKAKKTLVLAESCTGGLTSSMVTSVAGSSAVFLQGYITYSYEAKTQLLEVSKESLTKFGAVSEAVAREMALGARRQSGADVAVSITGIAGPGGGTPQKPVGTVWLAVSTARSTKTKLLRLSYNRELNQRASAYAALQLARDAI